MVKDIFCRFLTSVLVFISISTSKEVPNQLFGFLVISRHSGALPSSNCKSFISDLKSNNKPPSSMSDEQTKYEAVMMNRCLKETLTLGLEFKRLLEHIFTDEAVQTSEFLQKYQQHFLAFKGNFLASRNAFSEQLVASIERLDDSKLSKCSSPQCPLSECGPSVYERIFSPKESGQLKKNSKKEIESAKVSVIKEGSPSSEPQCMPPSASLKRPKLAQISQNGPTLISRANDMDTPLTFIPIINLSQQQAQTLPKMPIGGPAPKTANTLVLIQTSANTTGMSPSKPVISTAPPTHPVHEPPAKQIRTSVPSPSAGSGSTLDTNSLLSSGQVAPYNTAFSPLQSRMVFENRHRRLLPSRVSPSLSTPLPTSPLATYSTSIGPSSPMVPKVADKRTYAPNYQTHSKVFRCGICKLIFTCKDLAEEHFKMVHSQ